MQYRTFGRLDYKASALGFGAMRLPVLGGDSARIDESQAIRMIRWAIDHGVNYVDTAYTYHGGNGEGVVGKALGEGYRRRVKLATKLPCWMVESAGDFDRFLDEQLERLNTPTVDFYLLHSLSGGAWNGLRKLGVIDWADKQIARGRIGGLGFSFHDCYDALEEIIDGYDRWALCQMQYNYMDQDNQAGTKGLKHAAGKGLAVVVMEPLRGGRLAAAPPPVAELWNTASRRRTPAEWGLQWVWDHSEVSVVLSGMSAMAQVLENVAAADRSSPNTLTQEERALIQRVVRKYHELYPIPCTACEYCVPCPNGVNIPRILALYNESTLYGDMGVSKYFYNRLPDKEKADNCKQCSQCEERCPQKISVADALAKAHQTLKD